MTRTAFSRFVRRSATALAAFAALAAAQAGELTIYSSVEADNLKVFSDRFAKAHPSIKINWVRDSTGVIQARLMAEKDNPRNDVIFGHAATDLLALDAAGLFLPYAPAGVDKLDARYRDKKSPPTWSGLWGFAAAVCFNTVEAAKRNIPKPTSWADLTKPVYKGQITMPNPASSGTGFLSVAGWVQIMGKDKAWSYMDALHGNIAAYSHSGSKPCNQVASGEYVVGISLPGRAADLKTKGAPIEAVIPEDGIGWEMQGVSIMKSTKNAADAKDLRRLGGVGGGDGGLRQHGRGGGLPGENAAPREHAGRRDHAHDQQRLRLGRRQQGRAARRMAQALRRQVRAAQVIVPRPVSTRRSHE